MTRAAFAPIPGPAVTARPAYHYAPAANWLSDPNGLVHHDGEWHLFYQYNPHGDLWGHMAWGHAVSPDLARWEELAPALLEDEQHLIFSGSAVVDFAGTAGFGAGAMVAAYTGAAHAGGHQVQCLAASTDRGRTWTKFAGNPVLDRGLADFRDPNVFWHDARARWIMTVVLSEENRAVLYASSDLRRWRELSDIAADGLEGRTWECPLLIELPVIGEREPRWLFKVDVLSGGPGSGAVAVTGAFDGARFVPDRDADGRPDWFAVDDGRDFYAAIAWHAPRDAAGRPCWIGWMGNHAYQRALPPRGWRGAMSLPRRLALTRRNGRLRLVQSVEPAVAARFGPGERHAGATVSTAIPPAARITLRPGAARDLRLAVRDARGAMLALTLADGVLTIDRTAAFDATFDAPIAARDIAGDLVLWLDTGTLEIEGDGGARWIGVQHGLGGDALTLECVTDAPVTLDIAGFDAGGR